MLAILVMLFIKTTSCNVSIKKIHISTESELCNQEQSAVTADVYAGLDNLHILNVKVDYASRNEPVQ